jgi:hypothetical protein
VMKSCTSFVLLVSGNVLIAEDSTALSAIRTDAPGARINIRGSYFVYKAIRPWIKEGGRNDGLPFIFGREGHRGGHDFLS